MKGIGSYILKSGPHAGRSLAYIFKYKISDFLIFKEVLEEKAQEPRCINNYHRSILEIVSYVDKRLETIKCQHCQSNTATLIPTRIFGKKYEPINIALCRECFRQSEYFYQGLLTIPLSPWLLKERLGFKNPKTLESVWRVLRKKILNDSK